MTHIRVDPASVQSYGRTAQGIFEEMHQSLVSLVDDVVAVQYFGPNAVQFKSQCGLIAAEFAGRLHADMGAMADAVRTSTSNIAAALGGQPIVIQLDPRPIVPPTPQSVDFVDVDTAALDGLVPVVNQRFAALVTGLDANRRALDSTDWEGNAKQSASQAVGQFSTAATGKCTEAEQSLVRFITEQVNSVVLADV